MSSLDTLRQRNGAATENALPARIEEPEFSALCVYNERLAQAARDYTAAKAALDTFSPVLRARYSLGEGDEILPDGTILRGKPEGDST